MGKSGFLIHVEAIQHSGSMVGVTVRHFGNVDARLFPVPAGAEPMDGGNARGIAYRNVPAVEETVAFCRRAMAERGWIEYQRTAEVSPIPHEMTGSRVISLREERRHVLSVRCHQRIRQRW